jgi:hypothetical protein
MIVNRLIHLQFTAENTVGDRILRFMTRSRFSHVRVRMGESIFEARPVLGVTVSSRNAAIPATLEEFSFEVSEAQWDLGLSWLQAQVGKPYDYFGVLAGLMLQRNWQDDRAWYCAELAAELSVQIGSPLLNFSFAAGVSAQDLLLSLALQPRVEAANSKHPSSAAQHPNITSKLWG